MENATDLALIAGTGALPGLLAEAAPGALLCELEGFPAALGGRSVTRFRVERIASFLDMLKARGIVRVCFAGSIRRPAIDLAAFDAKTAALAPRIAGAMRGGDDATLRAVIGLFSEWGFRTVGADEIAPDLVPGAGVLTGEVDEAAHRDAARAAEIVRALGAVDVGQGAVVAGGLCLAVEALPGTDAMLEFVALARARFGGPSGGLFLKAPKPHQDRRIDLPAIGPDTIRNAARAGLSGVVFEAGGVLLLGREATIAAAREAGLFLWGREA